MNCTPQVGNGGRPNARLLARSKPHTNKKLKHKAWLQQVWRKTRRKKKSIWRNKPMAEQAKAQVEVSKDATQKADNWYELDTAVACKRTKHQRKMKTPRSQETSRL